MKCKIPEISWHNRDPVLSVDIQSKYVENTSTNTYRLASGGTDAHVLIWYVSLLADGSDINLELAADLTRHQRAVNVVKWSPNGEFLASGDDESVIFIWKQKTETDPPNILETTTEQDKEVWLTHKILRGHMEDVYDLSWSPDSQFLVSGSVDNTAMIWDVHKGKSKAILSDHKGFVQGVAWDPCNQYVATLSTDRYLRIFDIQTKRVVQRINKGTLNVPEGHALHGQRMRLFHDDTLQTFFRRLSFTPDGKILLTPAGVTDFEGCAKPLHTTYGFSRYALRQPTLILPCTDQYTVAVSCCPILFKLRPYNKENNPPVVPLPYRMIFAVATRSSVYFYDTQQRQPFAIISNIHYTRLTDITWSSDGRVVIASSTDGFCSLITFEKGELGEQYEKMYEVLSSNDSVCQVQISKKSSKKQKENDAQEPPKSRKASDDDPTSKSKLLQTLKKIDELDNVQQNEESPIDEKPSGGAQKILSPKSAIVKPLLAADIILDKEILSSDEKFESPEKKSRPVTPITIRRHPRTPNNIIHTPTTTTSILPKTIADCLKNSPQSKPSSKYSTKSPTPIAVRRTPRAIIPIAPSLVDPPSVVEEAMDAWPIQIPPSPPPSSLTKKNEDKAMQSTKPESTNENTSDRTQDIRLVYEDTIPEEHVLKCNDKDETNDKQTASKSDRIESSNLQENNVTETPQSATPAAALVNTPKQQPKSETPTQMKTPRRVEFRTISTPKSKKKLL